MRDQKGEVDDECFDALSGALIESSVRVTGKVIRTDREHGYELSVSSGIVVGAVNPDSPFPITESAMAEADGGKPNSSSITDTCT